MQGVSSLAPIRATGFLLTFHRGQEAAQGIPEPSPPHVDLHLAKALCRAGEAAWTCPGLPNLSRCPLPAPHGSCLPGASPDLAVLLSILPVASLFREAVLERKRDRLPKQAVARRHLLPVCSHCAKGQPKCSN